MNWINTFEIICYIITLLLLIDIFRKKKLQELYLFISGTALSYKAAAVLSRRPQAKTLFTCQSRTRYVCCPTTYSSRAGSADRCNPCSIVRG